MSANELTDRAMVKIAEVLGDDFCVLKTMKDIDELERQLHDFVSWVIDEVRGEMRRLSKRERIEPIGKPESWGEILKGRKDWVGHYTHAPRWTAHKGYISTLTANVKG